MSLDYEKGPLWKLSFLKIESDPKPKYYSFLTYDHSIYDGRSSAKSMIELFALIERVFEDAENFKREDVKSVILPPKEVVFVNRKYDKEGEYAVQSRIGPPGYSKMPDFFSTPLNTGI